MAIFFLFLLIGTNEYFKLYVSKKVTGGYHGGIECCVGKLLKIMVKINASFSNT